MSTRTPNSNNMAGQTPRPVPPVATSQTAPSSGTDYEFLAAQNPYSESLMRQTWFDKLLNLVGLRSGYDNYETERKQNEANYKAELAALQRQEMYNSPAEQNERLQAAGINSALSGGEPISPQPAQEGSPVPYSSEAVAKSNDQFSNFVDSCMKVILGVGEISSIFPKNANLRAKTFSEGLGNALSIINAYTKNPGLIEPALMKSGLKGSEGYINMLRSLTNDTLEGTAITKAMEGRSLEDYVKGEMGKYAYGGFLNKTHFLGKDSSNSDILSPLGNVMASNIRAMYVANSNYQRDLAKFNFELQSGKLSESEAYKSAEILRTKADEYQQKSAYYTEKINNSLLEILYDNCLKHQDVPSYLLFLEFAKNSGQYGFTTQNLGLQIRSAFDTISDFIPNFLKKPFVKSKRTERWSRDGSQSYEVTNYDY